MDYPRPSLSILHYVYCPLGDPIEDHEVIGQNWVFDRSCCCCRTIPLPLVPESGGVLLSTRSFRWCDRCNQSVFTIGSFFLDLSHRLFLLLLIIIPESWLTLVPLPSNRVIGFLRLVLLRTSSIVFYLIRMLLFVHQELPCSSSTIVSVVNGIDLCRLFIYEGWGGGSQWTLSDYVPLFSSWGNGVLSCWTYRVECEISRSFLMWLRSEEDFGVKKDQRRDRIWRKRETTSKKDSR